MAHMQHKRGPVFGILDSVGSVVGGAVSGASHALEQIASGGNHGGTGLEDVFNKSMAEQKKLYAQITELNTKKNEQSSYLSLAKGVSEKV